MSCLSRRLAPAALGLAALFVIDSGRRVALGGLAGEYAVFGRGGVAIGGGSTINGVVASNGDISVDTFATINGLAGGGSLLLPVNSLGDFTIKGGVTFNGSVTTGQYATIAGAINAGGDVSLGVGATTSSITASGSVAEGQAANNNGNVAAGGSFSNGVFGVVTGNVAANANVTVNGTVQGNVTYGQSLTVGTFGAVSGSTAQGTTTVSPASYSPTALPPALGFTAGGPSVTTGGTATSPLAPGSYGALSIGTFGNLYLTAGNYYFTSVSLGEVASIHLLDVGPDSHINIFVTGNVFEDTFANVTVNGLAYNQADPSLAADVLLETLGNYSQDTLGSVNFFGTIFAPDGDVSTGTYSNLTGQVIAGGQVNLGGGFNQDFIPLVAFPVPEPSSLMMGAIAVATGLVVARGRHQRDR